MTGDRHAGIHAEDDAAPRRKEEKQAFAEESASLWRITFSPALWAVHFVASYGATAVFCAKFGRDAESILPFRQGVGAATLLVLAAIGWLGWRSWRQWSYLETGDYENALANEEDRTQFLGHAAFLLSIVSFVGVIYTGLPVLFVETCR